MNREHYWPALSDREPREEWEAKRRTTAEKAHERVRRLLAEPRSLHIPRVVAAELLQAFPAISKAHYEDMVLR